MVGMVPHSFSLTMTFSPLSPQRYKTISLGSPMKKGFVCLFFCVVSIKSQLSVCVLFQIAPAILLLHKHLSLVLLLAADLMGRAEVLLQDIHGLPSFRDQLRGEAHHLCSSVLYQGTHVFGFCHGLLCYNVI